MEVRPVSHVQVRLYYTHVFSTVKVRVLKFTMHAKIVHSFFKIGKAEVHPHIKKRELKSAELTKANSGDNISYINR